VIRKPIKISAEWILLNMMNFWHLLPRHELSTLSPVSTHCSTLSPKLKMFNSFDFVKSGGDGRLFVESTFNKVE